MGLGQIETTIVGNLTSDPELRYTQNGLAVANFTIAVQERTFDKQANEWKDGQASFVRCSVWREFAENVAGSLGKGSRVIAQVRMKQRDYQTREGEKRTAWEAEVEAIGPELRYGTTNYTRNEGGNRNQQRNQEVRQQQQNGGGQPQGGQQGGGQQGGYQSGGADVWDSSAPQGGGTYNDETPF